jgi:hypothetical protein
MLVHAFFHLFKESPEVAQWLLETLPAGFDTVEVPGVSNDKVRVIAHKNGHCKYSTLSGPKLLSLLERNADSPLSVAVAWLLLCFHDVYYDTDALLHDYVQNVCSVRLEHVPFFLAGDNLVAICDHTTCVGKPKKSDKAIFQVDKNIARVLLPLSSPELRELLFGRLRRIDT